MNRFQVRKVAVLGAGVMGAQIAAHLVNVKVPVVLFDLPAKEGPKNGIVAKAVENLKKIKPAPLGVAEDASLIQQANYEEHLDLLAGCDLVIEAIAERMDWKLDLYTKIAPHLAPGAIVASNTSGLSITKLASVLPDSIKPRFCGIHFFNPPRYMALVELINTPTTDASVLDELEAFVTTFLGKSVVRAKDSPNFIANRVGIAGMLATMKEAETFGLTFDVVDDLTGKKLGRASSGTFRTADVVGLDTMAHVIKTLQDNLAGRPLLPLVRHARRAAGPDRRRRAGPEDGRGLFQEGGQGHPAPGPGQEGLCAGGRQGRPHRRAHAQEAGGRTPEAAARKFSNPQAQFLWAILRDAFHYAAVHLEAIADTARDVDFAMRWGFGSKQGPFELWQEAGWQQVAGWVKEDIEAGKALCAAPLPAWVFDGRTGVHTPEGSWSPTKKAYVAKSSLPVYARQPFGENVFGAGAVDPLKSGTEAFRNDDVRVWTNDGQVLIASITCKLHLISPAVVEGLLKAVEIAESQYQGLVIWSPDDVFSAGANLEAAMPIFMKEGGKGVGKVVKAMQDAMLRIRYANVPVVAAMRGIALGGGNEIALACARRVAHMETYVGLVEVGVGLVPAGGGLAYIARRAAENAATAPGTDLLNFVKDGFMAAATAKVGTSAIESRKNGWLLHSDIIVAHKDELLHVATAQVKALAESGYRAPQKSVIPAAGRSALATIKGQMVNMRDGGFISQHDFHIGSLIAEVVCGGDVDPGSLVTEEYLMTLERKHFCALLDNPKTQERIMGMLQTGKPVRN